MENQNRQIKIYKRPWKESLHCEFSPWIRGPPRGLRQIIENVSLRQSGPDQRRGGGWGRERGPAARRSAGPASLGKKTDTYLLRNYNCSWKIFIRYKYCCYFGHCKLNYFVVKNIIIISTITIIMILIIINIISNVVIIIIIVILI